MKKSRPWNLNKESILKPSFNTFISPHKIIDISARVDKKKKTHLIIDINRIFLKTVSILSVIVSFSLFWYFSSHGRLSELIN